MRPVARRLSWLLLLLLALGIHVCNGQFKINKKSKKNKKKEGNKGKKSKRANPPPAGGSNILSFSPCNALAFVHPPEKYGNPKVCAGSEISPVPTQNTKGPRCPVESTWSSAAATCAEAGMRLCTTSELAAVCRS